ncbi:DUF4352 domain-containing protein [Paractinoplanes maris]|uniref:DUF4352 domain-containing protein n=1 Tax=Paractinoplanes maris TaxID=1734446 RepID=UPI0020200125|nr:DUF4352 domain-containing protein [Actinoplanes maris]
MSHDPRPPYRPRPRRRLHPLVAVVLACAAVAALFLTGVAAQQLASREPAAATAATAPKTTPSVPKSELGHKVRDGKFEFVVSRVDCSRTTVGLERLKRTAKGKFCMVSLSVRNIADGSRYFLGHAQKAVDATGASYRNDTLAGVYANLDIETFLRKLGPGELVTGRLVFDVPKQAKLTSLVLHDSPLSGGATITL